MPQHEPAPPAMPLPHSGERRPMYSLMWMTTKNDMASARAMSSSVEPRTRASSMMGTELAIPWLPLPAQVMTESGQPPMRASDPAAVAEISRRARLLRRTPRVLAPAPMRLPTSRP